MFTEDDSKRQDNAFAMLKDEFSRLEEMGKTLRKAVGLPEDGEFVLNEADMTPEIRKALDEAKARARSDGAARAAQFKAASSA